MGQIGKLKRRGQTTWFYRVDVGRNALGKSVQKMKGSFPTRHEAERAMRELMRDLDNGT